MPRARSTGSFSHAIDPVRLVLRRNPSRADSEDTIGDGGIYAEAVLDVAREASSHLQSLEEATNACHLSFAHISLLRVEFATGRVREDVIKLRGLLAYGKDKDETAFRIAKSQLDSIQKRCLHLLASVPSSPPAVPGTANDSQDRAPWYTLQQTAAQRNQCSDVVQRKQEIQAVKADLVRLDALFQEVKQLTTMQDELLDLTDKNVDHAIVDNEKAYEKLTISKRWGVKVRLNEKKLLAIVLISVIVIVVAGIIVLVVLLL